MLSILLAAILTGQSCGGYGGYGYNRNYGYGYNTGYGNYGSGYAPIYVPYVEKVKIVPVEQVNYQSPVYASLAATPLRSEERYQEYRAQQPQQTIIYTQTQPQPLVQQQTVYQAPAPSPQIQQAPAPSPQIQQVPAPQKSAPLVSPQYLQTPEKNPPEVEYGSQAAPLKTAPVPSDQTYGVSSSQDNTSVAPPPLIGVGGSIYGSMGGDDSGYGDTSFSPPIRSAGVPGSYQPSGNATYSLDLQTTRVLSKNCASCHTGSRSKGGFELFSAPGQLAGLTKDRLQDIYDQVLLGQQRPGQGMPSKRTMSPADGGALLNALRGTLATIVAHR